MLMQTCGWIISAHVSYDLFSATYRTLFWYHVGLDFMNACVNSFYHQGIVKSPQYGSQLDHMFHKLDWRAVTESTQGKIYVI